MDGIRDRIRDRINARYAVVPKPHREQNGNLVDGFGFEELDTTFATIGEAMEYADALKLGAVEGVDIAEKMRAKRWLTWGNVGWAVAAILTFILTLLQLRDEVLHLRDQLFGDNPVVKIEQTIDEHGSQ